MLILLSSIHAQDITYKITEIKVNGNSIADNAPIEFGSSSSLTVRFKVTFTKPNALTIGSVSHVIGTQSPSGFIQLITPESFALNSGNTGFSGTWEKVIYATDYSSTGENYLVSKITQTAGTPPLSWESTRVPIVKAPTFTLSPTTLALSCDDTNVKNFTVTPSNIPAGATVTYQWSFSGWSGSATSSMSSVNLTPISGTTLPSSVTVTPFINGVAKPSMTCIVSRGSFNPNYTITGNNQGCPGSTTAYSISVGTNTVSWSVSNPALATLNTTTGNNVLLTGISNGSVNLNALVTNSCGQSKLVTKTIAIGTPVVTNNTITGGSSSEPINSTTQLSVAYVTGATGYNWTVNSQSSSCVDANGIPVGGVTLPKFSNGSNTITTVSPIAFVNWGSCPGDVVVNCSAVNACGNKGIGYKVVSVYGYGGGGGGEDPCQGKMTVSPNPVKDDVFVVNIALPPVDPCGPVLLDRTGINNKVTIYDLQGNKVFSKEYDSDKISISNLNLRKGHYVIHADSNKGKNHKSIIVVE